VRDAAQDRSRRAAALLWDRWRAGDRVDALPPELRPSTVAQAWPIQAALTELAGPRIGWKIAASSTAGQQHIGVPGPIAGPLLEPGALRSGGGAPLRSMAAAEPEIAFRLGADLLAADGPHDRDTVLGAVAEVRPAIELPDSRYTEPAAVGAAQLVADLACAAYVVVGEPVERWSFEELRTRRVDLRRNGEIVSTGAGSNALGDPCAALLWLVEEVTRHGSDLRAGELIITGAAAPPRTVRTGDVVSGEVEGAAPVTVTIT
jgi:2-keto-4-pentenoate hydratase